MNIWTREELLSLLASWKAAYAAASTGKSYTIQGRTLMRTASGEYEPLKETSGTLGDDG